MSSALVEPLAKLLAPDRVLSEDAAARYAIGGMRPSLAVLPESVEDVAAILRFAGEHGLTVVPWGGGTLMDLGRAPRRFDVALDCALLNRIVEYQPADLVVAVQAGMTIAALNERLAQHGQMLALDPPLAERATIGGALSADSWGPSRLRYGTARDLVIGLTCVLADGAIVHSGGRVVKNVAGYDMNKLYVGALGTLGVIVEAAFKLYPVPAHSGGIVASFSSLELAHGAALAIVNSQYAPTAVELIAPAAGSRLLTNGAGGSGWSVAVSFAGFAAAVERQTMEVAALAAESGASTVMPVEERQTAELFRRIRDYGREAASEAAVILRAGVLPSELATLIGALDLDGEPRPELIASPGAGSLRLFWKDSPPALPELVARVRAAVEAMSGSLVVERCPPELEQRLEIWGIAGADVELMRDLKRIFDPTGMLSPGRYVD